MSKSVLKEIQKNHVFVAYSDNYIYICFYEKGANEVRHPNEIIK